MVVIWITLCLRWAKGEVTVWVRRVGPLYTPNDWDIPSDTSIARYVMFSSA